MNNEWIEGARRAFDDSFLSLNEVENIDCPQRVVRRRTRKPVPARFNEFQFVEPCALLAPTRALPHRFNPIDQVFPDPFRVTVPNDVCQAVFEMNRSWRTIQAEPAPVPQLEGENIRRCAYLKNHAISISSASSSESSNSTSDSSVDSYYTQDLLFYDTFLFYFSFLAQITFSAF